MHSGMLKFCGTDPNPGACKKEKKIYFIHAANGIEVNTHCILNTM